MHRIGRAGRFGTPGVAVTIFDKEKDEAAFWQIIEHYKMQDKVSKLDSVAKVGELMDEINTV